MIFFQEKMMFKTESVELHLFASKFLLLLQLKDVEVVVSTVYIL